MKTIEIKNFELNTFAKVINYPMNFQKGRVKNRFIKILKEKYDAVEVNRLEIIDSLANKDKDGNKVSKDGQFQFSTTNQPKFNEAYQKLMMDVSIIDVLPSIEKDVSIIKEIINNSPIELDTQETEQVEEIVLALNGGEEKSKAIKNNKTKNNE